MGSKLDEDIREVELHLIIDTQRDGNVFSLFLDVVFPNNEETSTSTTNTNTIRFDLRPVSGVKILWSKCTFSMVILSNSEKGHAHTILKFFSQKIGCIFWKQ